MLVNRIICLTLLISLVAHSSQAAPLVSVSPAGLSGGNREWLVSVTPDPILFSNHLPLGIGGSIAVELALSVDDPTELLSVVVADSAAWPKANTGHNPFTGGITSGTYIDLAA